MKQHEIVRVVYATIQADATIRKIDLPTRWQDLDNASKKMYTDMVTFLIRNPKSSHETVFNEWYFTMCNDGWIKGDKLCHKKKTHPDLRPYDELPFRIRLQHRLAHQIVSTYLEIK